MPRGGGSQDRQTQLKYVAACVAHTEAVHSDRVYFICNSQYKQNTEKINVVTYEIWVFHGNEDILGGLLRGLVVDVPAMKMVEACSSETSVPTYKYTRRRNELYYNLSWSHYL
jgi:hypothetical protein